jgi:hypothetical protein
MYISDEKGKRISAVIPIKKYEQLLSKLEEFAEIKAYDKAVRGKPEFVPLDKALKKVKVVKEKKQ